MKPVISPFLQSLQTSVQTSVQASVRAIAQAIRPRQRRSIAIALGLMTAVSISLFGQGYVKAYDSTQVATGSNWQGASFPVENFQAYTSPFGYRSSPDGTGSSTQFHRGLDLAAPEGSYIRSWWTGKVVEVSDNSSCGTSVVIESGQWEHIYCHMVGHAGRDSQGQFVIDREGGTKVYLGQTVAAGTRIGRVGMTGRTTGPHLHWGLKYAGQWVDPALVLRAMYAEQSGTPVSRVQ